jgi:hypothetical protein
MSATEKKWTAPDMGGAMWLEGDYHQAIVVLDPSGDTSRYLWAVQIDDYATDIAEGTADSESVAKAAARAALIEYERSLG